MRKIITTLLIIAAVYSTSYAQQKNNVVLGVNAGYNIAYVTEFGSKAVSGYNFGFSAEYYLSDSWSLKAKLSYDQKGWGRSTFFDPFGSTKHYDNNNLKLNYLTIPVMASLHLGKNKNWYLNIGPYAGILMDAHEEDIDIKETLNSFDAGIAGGVGLKIPVATKIKLFVEYDGQLGFADVFKNNKGSMGQTVRSAFNLGVNVCL